ncbi:MAG: hypothetical protein NWF05_03360 [Candidatus Bathyarchaeota archaeon]|nr:hypothetical protein [Candidatus Bathyarchaeota archaeon]
MVLISVGTVVAPVGAVVVMYHDNLFQLVVPPEIEDIINGNSTLIPGSQPFTNQSGPSGQGQFLTPVFVDAQVDNVSRTFSVTVDFNNSLGFDLTLKALSAGLQCTQHSYPLGTVGINDAIEIPAGEVTRITVTGLWTQDAETHFVTEHAGATGLDVSLVNVVINVNEIVVTEPGPISIGYVPMV